MSIAELLLLAVGLAMDAFAVSVSKGLSMKKASGKNAVIVGLYFGVFQAVMPLIGYGVGAQFKDRITSFDHWVAFLLLGFMGAKMIKESFGKEEGEVHIHSEADLGVKSMLILAVATSIDALAMGITFAFLKVDIISAAAVIGIVTFFLSLAGVKIGNRFGLRYKSKAELAGGIILIGMGLKILLEHLGVI